MKNLRIIASLLVAPLITSMTLAQTSGAATETSLPASIAVARCQYTPTDRTCSELSNSSQAQPDPDDATLAQAPRRTPGPPLRPRRQPMAHPRGGYPASPRMAMEPNGRRALIGALIGFGLGAAAGARANTDQHPGAGVKAAFLVGSVGGLLGALVGATVPSFHARSPYRYNPTPDDEQASHRGRGAGTRDQGSTAEAQEASNERTQPQDHHAEHGPPAADR